MTSFHKKEYGSWAGNERGNAPDFSRCAEAVHSRGSIVSHQCPRKNGHGPEGAFCLQHDPAEVQKRRDMSDYKFRLGMYERKVYQLGDTLPLIRAIAEGHNDPRALCNEWLEKHKKALTKPRHPEGDEQ